MIVIDHVARARAPMSGEAAAAAADDHGETVYCTVQHFTAPSMASQWSRAQAALELEQTRGDI